MRFCYAHRRFTLYPQSVNTWDLSAENYTDEFLARVEELGFDALEVGLEVLMKLETEQKVRDFASKLEDHGLAVGAIRSGGTLHDARNAPRNRERLDDAIRFSGWSGAEVVNGAMSAPSRHPGHPPGSVPGSQSGWPVSQDASRDAMLSVYDVLATVFQAACAKAADVDTNVVVEVHQNSPVDNSWSALLLTEKVDRPNFGINPDIGNILWTYDVPEESSDEAIDRIAPVAKYWHCKNLHRVYHPENSRSVFLRVPLTDGEIDYRYGITAMHNAGYSGYMAIEGSWAGDQWHHDARSLDYVKAIWAELEA